MPDLTTRSAEEWAKICREAGHYHLSDHCGARVMCLDCARAYAREVGEAVREEAEKIAFRHPCECPKTMLCGHRKAAGQIAAAIRRIEVKTP